MQANLPRFNERQAPGHVWEANNTSTTILEPKARKEAILHNLGTTKVYIRLGEGCSNINDTYNFILAPGQEDEDGRGEKVVLEWEGAVSMFGANAKVLATEVF